MLHARGECVYIQPEMLRLLVAQIQLEVLAITFTEAWL